jgi:hypothetical protein
MPDPSLLRIFYFGCVTLAMTAGVPSCSPAPAVSHSIDSTTSDTAAFYSWWVENSSVDLGPGGDTVLLTLPPGVRLTQLPLHSGYASEAVRRFRPPLAVGSDWSTSVLHQWDSDALVVWVPTDSTGQYSSSPTCTRHATWLGIIPRDEWTRLDLVPYCSETYGPDEVNLGVVPSRRCPDSARRSELERAGVRSIGTLPLRCKCRPIRARTLCLRVVSRA